MDLGSLPINYTLNDHPWDLDHGRPPNVLHPNIRNISASRRTIYLM
ncbi:MAG TPA: hypothetical protein VIQ76_09830 [Propionibacteriaceae bacterium]|jgi:hypothetical protein